MLRPKPERLDRATALRYMGAAGWEPDAASSALLDQAEKRLLEIATPGWCGGFCPVRFCRWETVAGIWPGIWKVAMR